MANDFEGFGFEALASACDTATPALLSVSSHLLNDLTFAQVVDQQLLSVDPDTKRFKLVDGINNPPIPLAEEAIRPALDGYGAHVRVFGLVDALTRGATVVVNDISQSSGGRLSLLESDIARVLGAVVQTNVYLSEREAKGFGRHWDDHDVIILQARGRKLWSVYEPTELSPQRPAVRHEAAGALAWSGVLAPGQALYVPRGWSHEVGGFASEFSLHYTIGITRSTGLHLVDEVVARGQRIGASARSWPLAEDVPVPEREINDELLDSVVAGWRGTLPIRRTRGPMWVIDAVSAGFDEMTFDAPFPGGAVFTEPASPEGEIGLFGNRVAFSVDRTLVPIVALMLEQDEFRVVDLLRAFPDLNGTAVRALVKQLCRWDLVRPRP